MILLEASFEVRVITNLQSHSVIIHDVLTDRFEKYVPTKATETLADSFQGIPVRHPVCRL